MRTYFGKKTKNLLKTPEKIKALKYKSIAGNDCYFLVSMYSDGVFLGQAVTSEEFIESKDNPEKFSNLVEACRIPLETFSAQSGLECFASLDEIRYSQEN